MVVAGIGVATDWSAWLRRWIGRIETRCRAGARDAIRGRSNTGSDALFFGFELAADCRDYRNSGDNRSWAITDGATEDGWRVGRVGRPRLTGEQRCAQLVLNTPM